MKRCPNGHVTQNDSLNFCTECGKMLEPYMPADNGGGSIVEGRTKPKRSIGGTLKRIVVGVIVLLVVAGLWISSKINSTTYLVFNTEAVVFPKCGDTRSVSIDYDGLIWEVSYKPSWLQVVENDDTDELTLVAYGNDTGTDREDHVTVKSGRVVAQLPVGQLGYATYLRAEPSKVDFSRGGGTEYVTIESDGLLSNIKYPDFVDVETEDNGFNIHVGHNGGNTRNGIITVTEDGRTASIHIHQVGACPDCNGRGQRNCVSCGGLGQVGFGMFSSQCYFCGGRGSVSCSSCHGSGER